MGRAAYIQVSRAGVREGRAGGNHGDGGETGVYMRQVRRGKG